MTNELDKYYVISDITLRRICNAKKDGYLALRLWFFYYQKSKEQGTARVWTTTSYCANGIKGFSPDKVRRAKKVLLLLGLIQEIPAAGQHNKAYIQINSSPNQPIFLQHTEKITNKIQKGLQSKKLDPKKEEKQTSNYDLQFSRGQEKLQCKKPLDKCLRNIKEKCLRNRKRKIFLKKNCKTSGKRNKGELRSQASAYSSLQRIGLNGDSSNKKTLPKIKIPKNPLKDFNFPDQVFEVLNHWRLAKGKIPKDPNRRKTADQISNQIQELLLPGNNPYTPVLKENEFDFRQKKWTVHEIKDTIDYYTKELCRTIEDMYFSKFIIHRNLPGMKTRTLKDYSPLVETYQLLPQQLSYLAKKLKSNFVYYYDNVHFYDKTFIKIGTFFEEKLIEYKSYIPHANMSFCAEDLPSLFLAYMDKQVIAEGKQDSLKYMAKKENLINFIKHLRNLNVIKSRTDEELKNYKKEEKTQYKTQYNEYLKMIESGTSKNWDKEAQEYFKFLKEKVKC